MIKFDKYKDYSYHLYMFLWRDIFLYSRALDWYHLCQLRPLQWTEVADPLVVDYLLLQILHKWTAFLSTMHQ